MKRYRIIGQAAAFKKVEAWMRTGACSACEYSPVAFGANTCPNCGARNPNPGIAYRFAGRGMLIGAAGGALIGGVLGYCIYRPEMGFGGVLAGALPCMIVGLALGLPAGLATAFVAWLCGEQ